jgi:hypothetical protein
MSEDMNLNNKQPSHSDDLVAKAARFGAMGWIAFFITLLFLLVQNIVYTLSDKQVMATQDGQVIGQVIFDEAKLRSNDEIMADLKNWVKRCTSVNKTSIYEDLSVCLNHMSSELAEERLADYEKHNYAVKIEQYGCENTLTIFDSNKTHLERDSMNLLVVSTLSGEKQCITAGKKPTSQPFSLDIIATLKPRTDKLPLAFHVTSYGDNEE